MTTKPMKNDMPRGPRLDVPGTLHHVILRGIERGVIFQDDADRTEFLRRFGELSKASGTGVYAFALMTNHVHVLLRSGKGGLATMMRRLLSGYAQYYNRRYNRSGHLFQNRYKSIICEEDAYFTKLVAYIHLNPLKAGIVRTFDEIEQYPWSSHACIMRRARYDWFDREYVLRHFGSHEDSAIWSYLEYLSDEMTQDREAELSGGGLIRSHGGWSNVLSMRKQGLVENGDARVLGSGEFVRSLLEEAEASVRQQISGARRQELLKMDIEALCQDKGISLTVLRSGSRRAPLPELRKALAVKFVEEYGLSLAETARQLGVTTNAVAYMLKTRL